MSRWIRALAVLVIGTAGLYWSRANSADPAVGGGRVFEEVLPFPALNAPNQFEYVGAGSCASTACHGGPPGPEAWSSSYRAWNSDPHALAYSRLFCDRSKRMVRLLPPIADNVKPPHEDKRCLACHSIAEQSHHSDKALLADGVSCEICHGPAGAWLVEHTTSLWKGLSASQKERRGLLDIGDFSSRAQLCVKCHVGAPPEETTPARDVNHDLIAAGHPRLNFEFTAYLSNMPVHWDRHRERQRHGDTGAHAWTIGQVESARAAIQLLQHRAAADPQQHTPWPEFAEYNCFACHHDLAATRAEQSSHAYQSQANLMAWGTWYFSGLRLLEKPGATEVGGVLDELRKAMSSLTSDQAHVANLAGKCAGALDDLACQVGRQQNTSAQLAQLRSALSHVEDAKNWDEAAQIFLALSALNRNERVALPTVGREKANREPSYESVMEELRYQLTFPVSGKVQKSKHICEPPAMDEYYSPRDFDVKPFNEALRKIFPEQDH